ncbi:hypothetical protein DPV78_004605 [Talaromyces pinophilus]|nr:hypothetical protein DPV78_004605 [Talaromyces pinophilus]
MEPGGESTQSVQLPLLISPLPTSTSIYIYNKLTQQTTLNRYESIRTVTVTPPKEKGQLGAATQKSTISPLKVLSKDEPEEQRNNNGEQAARDPTLQGPQTAGMTSGVSGEVDKDLKPDAEGIDEEARRTRTAQRLGPGTGIGA